MAPKPFEESDSWTFPRADTPVPHFYSLRHKGTSFLHRIRSRSSSDYLRQRAPTPTPTLTIPGTVPEIPLVREGPIGLKTSSSAMFIAKMNSDLFLSQFKRAQEAYLTPNLPLCQHRCLELLSTPALHLDTRIETLQLLATISPLSVASEHLADALCLLDLAVERGGLAEAQMQGLLGLRITTLDLVARVEREVERVRKEEGKMDMEEWMAEWKKRGSLRGQRMSRNVAKTMLYRPVVMQIKQSMPLHGSEWSKREEKHDLA
ncbi:hypothetical protein VTL71DRAFT_14630 [Oculimacula yallundae]|uniref:Uncharacterized protein n=1 Tax=Oculimacula yallundae TaxID=86028 RepID=A0ABR4CJ12_9HELO